jgi:hypothetical protein
MRPISRKWGLALAVVIALIFICWSHISLFKSSTKPQSLLQPSLLVNWDYQENEEIQVKPEEPRVPSARAVSQNRANLSVPHDVFTP